MGMECQDHREQKIMNTNAKKTGKANRYIEMSPDNARKATEEYLKTWDEKRPLDIREFVLREKGIFRSPLEKGFGPADMQDYLRAKFEVKKSLTYCKKLIKELKESLSKNGEAI